MLIKKILLFAVIICGLLPTWQETTARPYIDSFTPADNAIFIGGTNGVGANVPISFDLSTLYSCMYRGEWLGFEVWVKVDGSQAFYYRQSKREDAQMYYNQSFSFSRSITVYMTPGSHSIQLIGKGFYTNHDLWLDTDYIDQWRTVRVIPQYNLTVSSYSDPFGAGTVSVNGEVYAGIRTFPFIEGTSVNISASPSFFVGNVQYNFSSWSDGVTQRSRNIIMNSDKNLHSNYSNIPASVTISGPSDIFHPIKGVQPPTYTWSALASGGTPPYTFSWYRNGYYLGSGSPFSITLGYDGVYNPYTWTLSVTVSDASQPTMTATASKVITEYSASGPIDPKAGADAESITLPDKFSLQQNYPNPFNPETEIAFSLPEQASVNITVLDILGREVLLLEDGIIPAGNHKRTWKGINTAGNKVGSGIYLYRFTAKGESGKEFVSVKKMLMTK